MGQPPGIPATGLAMIASSAPARGCPNGQHLSNPALMAPASSPIRHRWIQAELAEGEAAPTEGRNDFGTVGYRGPCPPHGHRRHRYRFRLHAVTGDLGLAPGVGVQELERAVAAKVVAVAELVGTYQRQR